ncbi:uncharacterized protein L203_104283 [Cryptococcus depauperatus CBS 7841]|uniref:Uncharacterized protein n=1 Tax=Cryptococcus depauperatus CBS 7841 TaxID=1295531 RepID=A0A1E3I5K6_9TREE|nr:hypothetical protein L203_05289 [Cryptococcus depauperatus CBS 7841]
MGRSKPRTNKRLPPKIRPQSISQHPTLLPLVPFEPSTASSFPSAIPHSPSQSLQQGSFPPIDFTNPSEETIARLEKASQSAAELSAALSSLTEEDLRELKRLHKRNPLPALTEAQMTAITNAAARVGGAGLLPPPSVPSEGAPKAAPGAGVETGDGKRKEGEGVDGGQGDMNMTDVQASLAALFQAKLTLDREKERLMRMQEELKGQKELQSRELEHLREREFRQEQRMDFDPGMMLEEGCTCGQCHVLESTAESECFDCEEGCGCDCHSYEEYDCVHDDDFDDQNLDYDVESDCFYERRPLAEDPERLDKTVKELFNWIKTVVWTIEQAAIVSGRRNWTTQPPVPPIQPTSSK